MGIFGEYNSSTIGCSTFFNKKIAWKYQIVPHREDGYESLNPYYIGVIFDTEPQVEYKYFARNKVDVIQQGWYSSRSQSDLLHEK